MKKRTKRPGVHPGEHASAASAVVPPEVHEKAREAWLAFGTVTAVSQAAGVSREVATRLIDSGEPRLKLPSLRDCARAKGVELDKRAKAAEKADAIEQAKEHAQALRARLEATKKARKQETLVLGDAVASREEEVKLVRANRISALVLTNVNARLLELSVQIADSLLSDAEKIRTMGVRDRMSVLRTIGGIVHRTTQASAGTVNMNRLLMGEPTTILGRADPSPVGEMTEDEAAQWLALANKAFEKKRARQRVLEAKVVSVVDVEDEDVAELVEGLEL
jgi:hypothetical protein